MAEPIVERYERILRADPASRVFIELARALLERGETARAAEICARGVQHHPDSVLARIVWGNALLALGRSEEALARFDEATQLDPASPYAFDLAGEALVRGGCAVRALALLERGAQQHPRDPRIQLWQERARELAAHETPAPASPPPTAARASPPPLPRPVEAATSGGPSPAEISSPPDALDDGAESEDQTQPGDDDPADCEHETAVTAPDAPAKLSFTNAVLQSARRHVRALALITLALAGSAGVATFFVVRSRERLAEARTATTAARAGLARDTLGSLREAARALDETRRVAPRDTDAAALLAEISALLAHDFGDGDARGTATAALTSNAAGPGTYTARFLLAPDAERDAATSPLLSNRTATPLASAIAGELLAALGDVDAGRATLEEAAKARPPMLRAIVSLGNLDLSAGDLASARERYQAVLRIQPTHPGAALGLAEASLAAGQDVPVALQTLEAVAADPGSTVPAQDRLRFELVHARLLAAAGRVAEALPILEQSADRHPGQLEIVATRATLLAAAGDLDAALGAAETALKQSHGEARFRELRARLLLAQGRYRDLLATSDKEPTRTLLVLRGIARLSLGEVQGARAELEATRRGGKMTPEAAAWAALVEITAGRTGPAAAVVDALLEQPMPHPAALLARGRLDLAAGRRDSAEQHLRAAIERDPALLEARVALTDLLLETDRALEALELMTAPITRSARRGTGRVALARTLLAAGKPDDAVGELSAVIANAPQDPPAEAAARQLLRAIRRTGRKG